MSATEKSIHQNQISIVLGAYNRLPFLKRTIKSIRNNNIVVPYEIIVVDGGSTDGSLHWLQKQKDIITIVQHNHGKFNGKPIKRRNWGYFMNLGFKCAQGKYLVMISDDSLLTPGSVMNGYQYFEQRIKEGVNLGALAFFWRDWPGSKYYKVGHTFNNIIYVNHGMYLRSAFNEIGGLEEDELTFYYADTDFCLKLANAGYIIESCPSAFVEHFQHASIRAKKINQVYAENEWNTFLTRWEGIYYSHGDSYNGYWEKKTWHDPDKTVQQFPLIIIPILAYRYSIDFLKMIAMKLIRIFGLRRSE